MSIYVNISLNCVSDKNGTENQNTYFVFKSCRS